jgi:hypothetical protein
VMTGPASVRYADEYSMSLKKANESATSSYAGGRVRCLVDDPLLSVNAFWLFTLSNSAPEFRHISN